ncbi:MAG TPA: amidohydrolase family protein [Tepidisphaeraceae bacterium]|nr:amidohydrolase family protein [Tepidisphaeraceae bacterium]
MRNPVLQDGAVAFTNGAIVDVGRFDDIVRRHGDFAVQELGRSVLLPGLINAHTHLELSNASCGDKWEGRFLDWIFNLPQRGSLDEAALRSSIESATADGIEQCLKFGTTCVGDISQYPQFSRNVLADSPLRGVSYAEVLGSGKRRPRFDRLFRYAEQQPKGVGRFDFGVSPHAPYSVDLAGYKQSLSLSRRQSVPLATHLAEWQEESEFLLSHTGMFREVIDLIGSWDDSIETYPAPPIRFAQAIGLLDEPAVLAHVNYCEDEELAMLSAGRASVVYCPRTHRYFGHRPHRWQDMLKRGINVAVGTDSCASSPNLNLVDEIRLLHEISADTLVELLWQLITINAARALGKNDLGELSPGMAADFIAFEIDSANPLIEILETAQAPSHLWIAGEQLR